MIVLLETIHADAVARLEAVDEVRVVADPPVLDPALVSDQVRALVTRGRGRITVDTLRMLPALEVVGRCGAGLDNIDTAAAADAGIAVVHAPGATAAAVGEHATMLMLALARRVAALDDAVKAGNWGVRDGYEGVELRGKRLGIVGLGAAGTRIAEIGEVLGMEVVAWSPHSRDERFPSLALEDVLATADVIQVCVALTAETSGLIDVAAFASMRRGVLVVNTARGPIVDHDALRAAVGDGTVAGYAADVWHPEPPAPGDELLADDRVLVTPHIAALTDVTYREICVRTADAIVAVLTTPR